VADRRDEHAAPERVDHEPLQDLAVDVTAHPARAVTAGKKYGVDVVESGTRPGDGVLIFRATQHVRVCGAGIAIGAQESPDDDHSAQSRQFRPDVEAASGDHDLVGDGRPAAFGAEHDRVAMAAEDLPADRDLGGVEIHVRDRHQDGGHPTSMPPAPATGR
jgi:hypothetical protein